MASAVGLVGVSSGSSTGVQAPVLGGGPAGGDDASYEAFLLGVEGRLAKLPPGTKVFTTDANGGGALSALWEAFLLGLGAGSRQHYNCRSCQRFIEGFGGLVTLDERGVSQSVFWGDGVTWDIPSFFQASALRLRALVNSAKVTGVFLSEDKTWGTVSNRGADGRVWKHLSVASVPSSYVFRPTALKTVSSETGSLKEDFGMLWRGLAAYLEKVLRTACEALKSGRLYRAEKCEAMAEWLLALKVSLEGAPGDRGPEPRRDGLVWRAVAEAPVGWCHVRSGVLGTLLDDLTAGGDFDAVAKRWEAKMHPLQYQRPTALPTEGAVREAEKVVAALNASGALRRRFARLEDIQEWVWQPRAAGAVKTESSPGFFAAVPRAPVHGHPKGSDGGKKTDLGEVTITWTKFRRTVLENVSSPVVLVEAFVPGVVSLGSLVTAADEGSTPVVQWDQEGKRNPVTWFYYDGGKVASHWGLVGGAWAKVSGITPYPFLWNGGAYPNHGEGVFVLLEGARDKGQPVGGGLFPEHLKSDFHPVRRTLEAHFTRSKIEAGEQASACGLGITKGDDTGKRSREVTLLRVTTATTVTTYKIDRWD